VLLPGGVLRRGVLPRVLPVHRVLVLPQLRSQVRPPHAHVHVPRCICAPCPAESDLLACGCVSGVCFVWCSSSRMYVMDKYNLHSDACDRQVCAWLPTATPMCGNTMSAWQHHVCMATPMCAWQHPCVHGNTHVCGCVCGCGDHRGVGVPHPSCVLCAWLPLPTPSRSSAATTACRSLPAFAQS
jgi:hypothetical protein